MITNFLEKIFEHNNWANDQILQACSNLSAEQLDAQPQSATQGSIRSTLLHLVGAQYGYLRILTLPIEERGERVDVPFADLQKSIKLSGEVLLALARDPARIPMTRLQTRDGHDVDPWVIILQIINHATEHREQIKSMLSGLGINPPSIDGWDFGEVTKAMVPTSK